MQPRFLLSLTLATLLMTNSSAAGADVPATRLLTDFTPRTADFGWYVVNDNVMGGRSRGGFEPVEGALRFRGSTNTNGGGFSSIRTRTVRMDLSSFEGIEVRVKGDGRRYTWRLTTGARYRGRPVSYWADFETRKGEWVDAAIPFTAFKPQFRGFKLRGPKLDPRRIQGMGLMIYDKKDGPFELELARVRAFNKKPAFTLSDYRWERRVLVVFAPKVTDQRLAKQLADLRATQAAFDERDMTLILVLESAGSRAGDTPLSASDSESLRQMYGIPPGGFALRLVGKDGRTKRAAQEPVLMQDLYAFIDTMPMRRTEMLIRGD